MKAKKLADMNRPQTKPRLVRFNIDLDEWLERFATNGGYNSVPELVREIVRQFKEVSERRRAS